MNEIEQFDVVFVGHEGELTLVYDVAAGADGSARCRLLRVTFSTMTGEIRTPIDADPLELRDALRALLTSDDLTGTMTLVGVEADLSFVRFELVKGRGSITARLEPTFPSDGRLELTVTTDQAALANTLRQLEWLVAQIGA